MCTKPAKVPFSPGIQLSIISHGSTVPVAGRHTNNNLTETGAYRETLEISNGRGKTTAKNNFGKEKKITKMSSLSIKILKITMPALSKISFPF